jgi:hypothetical protein
VTSRAERAKELDIPAVILYIYFKRRIYQNMMKNSELSISGTNGISARSRLLRAKGGSISHEGRDSIGFGAVMGISIFSIRGGNVMGNAFGWRTK